MIKAQYEVFEALNPFFGVVLKGLRGLVDGKHYFDTFAEDALFESRYSFFFSEDTAADEERKKVIKKFQRWVRFPANDRSVPASDQQ